MILGIISISLWVATIIGFIVRNLWLQTKKLEEMVNKQQKFIEETKYTVDQVTKMFDTIDQENIFRANDYVGQMWLDLKALNDTLKNYK
jgi:uncharacterized membrane protein